MFVDNSFHKTNTLFFHIRGNRTCSVFVYFSNSSLCIWWSWRFQEDVLGWSVVQHLFVGLFLSLCDLLNLPVRLYSLCSTGERRYEPASRVVIVHPCGFTFRTWLCHALGYLASYWISVSLINKFICILNFLPHC